ncbi:MAG: PQQ-binding-like beta-propeller repeat protein [Bacteroidaceae bacterium]|nr:PQQ-binding-like beta-propeller repeat protein [Bacteroidaceae bacterium]
MNKKFVSLLMTGALALSATAQVTPYGWRGPEHNGNYPDTGLMASWPEAGPELVFETEDAGKGYSSPLVVGDKIYLTGMNEDQTQEVFQCYNLKGEKQYTVAYGNPWKQSYPETRTTPAVVDGKAYVISGMGEIVCINVADGSIVWKVDGGTNYQRKPGMWGTSECPLVYDDKVIYTPCGDQTTMVALNKNTGEEIWKSRPLGDKSGYVSPIMIEYKGKRQIVSSTALNAIGVNPDNGEIEWTFDNWGPKYTGKESNWDNIAPNSALYKDGKIFFCHGYDLNGFQLQLADDLKSVTVTWRTETLDTHHGGYVLVDGKVFGSNWINNNDGAWCCLDWETGKTYYEEKWTGGAGKGSIISADGKLFIYDERRGFVGLVNPTSEKFDVVSKFRVAKGSGPYWAHMSIDNGILYLRHGEYFAAYKIK